MLVSSTVDSNGIVPEAGSAVTVHESLHPAQFESLKGFLISQIESYNNGIQFSNCSEFDNLSYLKIYILSYLQFSNTLYYTLLGRIVNKTN